jgi:4-amino-4-deoxy-L-arabinose transferase-like glycosyltransferase
VRSDPAAQREVPLSAIAIAVAVVIGLLVLAPAYGFHRDELYFIVAGRNPALGYVDQPAFTPLLSAAMVGLFGLTTASIRLLPALSVGVIVLVAALIARDLGGSRRAQVLASFAVAASGILAAGHLDSTATYDLLAWSVVLWLVVRLLAGADPRLWPVVGIAAGLGLENKHLVLFLGAGLAAGILLARRWDVVRSPWAWSALGIAVVMWLPDLAWQASHGFPQLEMASAIARGASDERAKSVFEFLFLAGPLLFPVALAGSWWLLRNPAAERWRALGWATLVIAVLVLAVGGKSYYAAGVIPLLLGAGAIALDGWLERGRARLRMGVLVAVATLSCLISVVLFLPIVPVTSLGATPIPDLYAESAEQVGWPALVATVETTVATLSPAERDRSVLMTSNYGEAGALELPGHDLPPVVSGHNAYWDWGPPPDDRTVTILVGHWSAGYMAGHFDSCRPGGTVENGVGVDNQEQGVPIQVCTGLPRPWSEIWPDLRHLD